MHVSCFGLLIGKQFLLHDLHLVPGVLLLYLYKLIHGLVALVSPVLQSSLVLVEVVPLLL